MANYRQKTDEKVMALIEVLKNLGLIKYNQEVWDAIGFSKENLYNITNGRQSFTFDHLRKLCEIYNVNANWLFGLDTKIFNKVTVNKIVNRK